MHLLKRNNTYYYKLKIPRDLQKLIPLKEVRFSLLTRVKRDALLLSSTLTTKYYTLFTQLRSGIFTQEEVTHLISSNIYFERLYQKEGQLNLNNSSTPPVFNTLNKLSQKYSNDKVLTNTWTDKTLKAYSFVFMVFSKVVDVSKDVKKITREELLFIDYLLNVLLQIFLKF